MLLFFKLVLIAGVLSFVSLAFFQRGNLLIQRLVGVVLAALLGLFISVYAVYVEIQVRTSPPSLSPSDPSHLSF